MLTADNNTAKSHTAIGAESPVLTALCALFPDVPFSGFPGFSSNWLIAFSRSSFA